MLIGFNGGDFLAICWVCYKNLAFSFRFKSVSRCTSVTSSLIFAHSQFTVKGSSGALNGIEKSSGQNSYGVPHLSPSFDSSSAISAFKLYLGNGSKN